MSIVKRFISYKIPENSNYNQILVYESGTETGAFNLVHTSTYAYGTRATEYDNLDTSKWYKIRFYDSINSFYSPYSDAFYGGHFDEQEPFACVTSTFDGAGFATASGFYYVTRLSPDQIAVGNVIDSLKTARSYIDLITDDQSPYRYSMHWDTDISRRKYNAQIELMKKAEIYFAAALVYQDYADDKMMVSISGNFHQVEVPSDLDATTILPTGQIVASGFANSISIGQTTISESTSANDQIVEIARFNLDKALAVARYNNEKNLTFASYFDALETGRIQKEADFLYGTSIKYATKADALMELFKPSSISIRWGDDLKRQKFLSPGGIFPFASTVGTSISAFNMNIADLTGLGLSFNGVWFELSVAAMVANSVNGVTGTAVYPLETGTTLSDCTLVVNGITYWLDDWIDHTGTTNPGKTGTTGGLNGFSLDFNTGTTDVKIKWNYTLANGGFDITNTDDITLTYWTV